MGLHEWILIGLALVASAVVAVEIRKSKRPRPEPAVDTTTFDTTGGAAPPRAQHLLLVGHTAVTRLSIRRALEKRLPVTEASEAADGLRRLADLAGPDVDVTAVIDLSADQGDFAAAMGDDPRYEHVRLLIVAPEADTTPKPDGSADTVEYLPAPQSIRTLIDAIHRSWGDRDA